MDPNATLAIMLDRAECIQASVDAGNEVDHEASELADAVMNLHTWLQKGGFLPEQWSEARK